MAALTQTGVAGARALDVVDATWFAGRTIHGAPRALSNLAAAVRQNDVSAVIALVLEPPLAHLG